jgi:ferritin-like metal-binding protein YciE
MKNLNELFEHQLKDLYSAEKQLIEALPKMVKNANDTKLKNAFESHLEETKNHKKRLEEICDKLGIEPTGEKCKAMAGLIKEAEGFIEEADAKDVMDAGLIAEAQRVEHYEISGYGTAVQYAKQLGHADIAKKLKETLDEEYGADDKLTKLAESRLNEAAIS